MPSLREAPSAAFEPGAAEFRQLGYDLVDRIAEFHGSLPSRRLTTAMDRAAILDVLGHGSMPEHGSDAGAVLAETMPVLVDHALHNGHPKFLGYITSSGAPLGALADLLASAVNSNLAKWELSPIASEIEAQSIRWIAEFIGYPADCAGIMVSGGNMANLHALLAARQAAASGDFRRNGLYGEAQRMTVYVSKETHTWIEKGVEVSGLGASSIRWIETDAAGRIRVDLLEAQLESDRLTGFRPFLVVATAGTVGTGAIDPIRAIATVCRKHGTWLHVDGAYGAPAASLPEAPEDLQALALADSVAIDPHKWLYSPIDTAVVMTRNPDALRETFDFRPDYYRLSEERDAPVDYYRQGLENSRRFRALKVWLGLRVAGADGHRRAIREDIALARHLYELAGQSPDLEAVSQSLSITTFRYRPERLDLADPAARRYVDDLNRRLLIEIQESGELFVSNAILDGTYLLRACVVNFRTTRTDIESIVEAVRRMGRALDERMRPADLAA